MIELVFATNNRYKLDEIKDALGNNLRISSLNEMGIKEEIPEPFYTLEENAVNKVRYIHEKYHLNCFADDTGLEVQALNGRPGVFSSRYAGEGCSFEDNINKLLQELKGITNRNARFRTVLALIENGHLTTFEGIVDGSIALQRSGDAGFGYDPVFIPLGYSKSFAEMKLMEKNKISHRNKALQKLINYLSQKSLK